MNRVIVISVEIPDEHEGEVNLDEFSRMNEDLVEVFSKRGWRVHSLLNAADNGDLYDRLRGVW